jgi:uncharacterized protein YdiU (UPF0061 family)
VNVLDYKEDFDDTNWHLIQLSDVNDKIIFELLKNINSDLSEEFYISFESLMKISKEKTHLIRSAVDKIKETEDLRKIILDYIIQSENGSDKDSTLLRLYNPDFITRARTVMELAESQSKEYSKFILPLINDQDDSVRWAVLQFIMKNNLHNEEPIKKKLIERKKIEKNTVIKERLNILISE